jgi:type VI protein secretion system component VasK
MGTRRRIKNFLRSISLSNQAVVIILATLLCVFILLYVSTLFPQRKAAFFSDEEKDRTRSLSDAEVAEQKKRQDKEFWQTLPEREKGTNKKGV